MRASEAIRSLKQGLTVGPLPTLTEIQRAVDRVRARWPDVVPVPEQNERDALAREMLDRVLRWDWSGVSVQRVVAAAFAAFDEQRRDRVQLGSLRSFYIDEIETSDQETFLSSMFWVYIESFEPQASHTKTLAIALTKRRDLLWSRNRRVLQSFPEMLSPEKASTALADVMEESADPYAAIKTAGFHAPHATGLLRHASLAFIDRIGPRLYRGEDQARLFRWLKPEAAPAVQAGGSEAVAALLAHWVRRTPSEEMQSDLTRNIVAAYGDPRVHRGGIWAGFRPDLKEILLRWLTKEDMRFFCEVISATQSHHHWPPRRNFWLKLFDQHRIDEAWVAFGGAARDYAKRHYTGSKAINLDSRFAKQAERGGSTSLLIMRIGNKIVVDGCHSYKTHIFRGDDPKAPKLYQKDYYCDQIMRQSTLSKAHNPIPNWQLWVEQHI